MNSYRFNRPWQYPGYGGYYSNYPAGPMGGGYGYGAYYPDYTTNYPWGWEYDWYDYNANAVLDDNEIGDLVRDTLDSNPYITRSDKNNIDVKVKDGVVTLSGEVRNRRSKPLAYADAFWSAGVVDIKSEIKVKKREQKQQGQPQGQQQNR